MTHTDPTAQLRAALRQACESSEHCPCCGEDWPGRAYDPDLSVQDHTQGCLWPTVAALLIEPVELPLCSCGRDRIIGTATGMCPDCWMGHVADEAEEDRRAGED